MRGSAHAPETLERKGLPDIFTRGVRVSLLLPRQRTGKLSSYPDEISGPKRHVRASGAGQTHRGTRKFRTDGVGKTTGAGITGNELYRTLANATSAAAMVAAMSSGLCAADTKPASNADGAR